MKNNKILALALSAGLVVGGAAPSFAAETTPEDQPVVEEQEFDLEAEKANYVAKLQEAGITDEAKLNQIKNAETLYDADTAYEALLAENDTEEDGTTEDTTDETDSDDTAEETPAEESNDKYYVVGKREEEVTEDQIDEASGKFIENENKDKIITAFLNNNDAELEDFLKTVGLLDLMKVEDFRAYLEEIQKGELSETDADIIRGLSKKNIDEFSKRALIDYIVKAETDFEKKIVENPNRTEDYKKIIQKGEKGTDYLVVTEGPLSSLWKVGQYFDPDEVGGFAAGNETMFTEVSRKSIDQLTDADIELIFGKEGKIFPKYNVNWETGVVETDENGRPVKYTGEGLTKEDFKKLVKEAKDEITEVGTGKSGENGLITIDDYNKLEEESTPLIPLVPAEEIEEESPLIPLLPSEEVIPAPEQTPGNDHIVIPSIPEFPTDEDEVVVPGTVVDPVVDEDKPVVVGNDDEQKAKDLTDKLNEISKEIKDTLVENEKEVAKEDKEEVKPSDDNKEEGSKEEKEDKDDKADKEDKNDDNKADAKKEAVKVEKVVKHSNPKTGVESIVPVVSTLAISMAGIVATRKKNN